METDPHGTNAAGGHSHQLLHTQQGNRFVDLSHGPGGPHHTHQGLIVQEVVDLRGHNQRKQKVKCLQLPKRLPWPSEILITSTLHEQFVRQLGHMMQAALPYSLEKWMGLAQQKSVHLLHQRPRVWDHEMLAASEIFKPFQAHNAPGKHYRRCQRPAASTRRFCHHQLGSQALLQPEDSATTNLEVKRFQSYLLAIDVHAPCHPFCPSPGHSWQQAMRLLQRGDCIVLE